MRSSHFKESVSHSNRVVDLTKGNKVMATKMKKVIGMYLQKNSTHLFLE